jgi:hypothetical protein
MRKKFAKKKKNAVMKMRILFLTKVISVAMIVR